jgi:hypothetical protein
MNSEMPPRMTSAPTAIRIDELPLRPLAPPAEVEVGVAVGAAVVVVGVGTLGCGKPG